LRKKQRKLLLPSTLHIQEIHNNVATSTASLGAVGHEWFII